MDAQVWVEANEAGIANILISAMVCCWLGLIAFWLWHDDDSPKRKDGQG